VVIVALMAALVIQHRRETELRARLEAEEMMSRAFDSLEMWTEQDSQDADRRSWPIRPPPCSGVVPICWPDQIAPFSLDTRMRPVSNGCSGEPAGIPASEGIAHLGFTGQGTMEDSKEWDVFISHAGEDKEAVARPLALALKRAGLKVWLDVHELRLGDSLTEKIDEGLANSRFGVIVISPSFFEKHWPRKELAGLRAREEEGRKVILPIWHNVDKATVAKHSPPLADALAASTGTSDIDSIANSIIEVVFAQGSGSLPVSLRFLRLVETNSPKQEILDFVASFYLHVNSKINGLYSESVNIEQNVSLGQFDFDLCFQLVHFSIGKDNIKFVMFDDYGTDAPEFTRFQGLIKRLSDRISVFDEFRLWAVKNKDVLKARIPGLLPGDFDDLDFEGSYAFKRDFFFSGELVACRRDTYQCNEEARKIWVKFKEDARQKQIEVMTYDSYAEELRRIEAIISAI
jgi:hypothetical protein